MGCVTALDLDARGGVRPRLPPNNPASSTLEGFMNRFVRVLRQALQTLAGSLLGLAPRRLDALVQDGSLQEICHDDSTQDAP